MALIRTYDLLADPTLTPGQRRRLWASKKWEYGEHPCTIVGDQIGFDGHVRIQLYPGDPERFAELVVPAREVTTRYVPGPSEPGRFETELRRIVEELEDLEQDAEDCGELAVAHKILEARGPLASALGAAEQYRTGVMEPGS